MTRYSLPIASFGAVLLLAVSQGQGSAATRPVTGLSASAIRALQDTTPLYTEEQAAAGAALFEKTCVSCHEPGDYSGPKFKEKWNGLPMFDLYDYIHTKMPDDAIGTLTPEQSGDATAYILKQNGVRSGPNKIAPDSAAMAAVKLDFSAAPPPP